MIEPVIWDSNFFRLKIGKIRSNSFDYAIFQQEKKNYDLIYIFETSCNLKKINEIEKLAITPIDTKLTYTRNTANAEDIAEIQPYESLIVNEQLLQLAYESGQYSRYKIDNNFSSEQYRALYRQWIESSVNRELADYIFISNNPTHPTGFISIKENKNFAQIGLVAVEQQSRGKKIGQKLIRKAIFTACCNQLETIKVITQRQNSSACNLYELCGFELENSTHVYHFWNR